MPLELFGDFGFVGGENTTANPYQDRQTCINYYPEISPSPGSKEVVSLLGCPGLNQLAAAPGGGAPSLGVAWAQPSSVTNLPIRGCWVLPGSTQALTIIGNTCYLVTYSYSSVLTFPSLNLTSVGTLNTNTGPVSIRDNGVGGYAVIVDGPYGYFYNIATKTLAQITDPAFLGANRVAEIDGWWIFNQPGTQTFYTNKATYSLAFAGSSFSLSDSSTDLLMGVMENKEALWLPKERTTEIWYNSGGQYFPFSRLVGTMLQVGCKATHSIQRLNAENQDGLIWFGRSERGENSVIRTKGFTAETVSTPAVSDAISKYPITSDAIGYVYQEDGHEFYVLTFPTADKTWVYDASMPAQFAWHQRASYDPFSATFHRHRSNCFMNFAGMRIVGDYQNGTLYQLTRNSYSDMGWPLLARRKAPHIWNKENRERVYMASLQVDFAPGQGNASGLGTNPQATLTLSRDGGTTPGMPFQVPMGKIGQYTNRAIWRRLGFTRDTVAQIDVIDPVNRDIVGTTLKAMGT